MPLPRRRFVLMSLSLLAAGPSLAMVPPSAALAQEWVDPGPGRWQAGEREIVVTLGGQRLWAYEGETAVLDAWVSTGTA